MGLIKKTDNADAVVAEVANLPGNADAAKSLLTAAISPKNKDAWADGQREGNRRNVAATLTAAIVSIQGLKKEEAWETFKFFHSKMTELDQ